MWRWGDEIVLAALLINFYFRDNYAFMSDGDDQLLGCRRKGIMWSDLV